MFEATHQTVRLSPGKHRSPSDGACVMELASMLAGERFDDHPRSVCPAIAVILRGYNDGIDDARRQDLYRYASEVVGTRTWRGRVRRVRLTTEFFDVDPPRLSPLTPRSWRRSIGRAARRYAKAADDRSHQAFLRLVDVLVTAPEPACETAPPALLSPTRPAARKI